MKAYLIQINFKCVSIYKFIYLVNLIMNKKMKDMVIIQKNKIDQISESLNNILTSIDNNNYNNDDKLKNFLLNIDDMKNNILELEESIDNLQYNYDLSVENKNEKINNRIKNYEDTREFMKLFGPLLILYQVNKFNKNT